MTDTKLPEVWLRGPLPEVPAYLQPVAHALLQAKEEVTEMMAGFPEQLLWIQPEGLASVGFHLQHLTGVLDRLFTYAKGEQLTEEQLQALRAEGVSMPAITTAQLIQRFHAQIDQSISQLRQTPESVLTSFRGVGRKQLPSTVLGLLMHAAEHTMRHAGQLLVTIKFVQAGFRSN